MKQSAELLIKDVKKVRKAIAKQARATSLRLALGAVTVFRPSPRPSG